MVLDNKSDHSSKNNSAYKIHEDIIIGQVTDQPGADIIEI